MSNNRLNMLLMLVAIVMFAMRSFAVRQSSEMANLLHRPIRAASFPDSSALGLYVALSLPLENPGNDISLSYFFEATYGLPVNSTDDEKRDNRRKKRNMGRSTIYGVLENKLTSAGFPGRYCLLRSICDAQRISLRSNGVLGDVMHVLFTPSTSEREDLSEDIVEAEVVGHNGSCSKYYTDCPLGLFDLIGILV